MLINYKCGICDNEIIKYALKSQEAPETFMCHCGGTMQRDLPDFGSLSVEVIDNGSMAKPVELKKDAAKNLQAKGDLVIKQSEDRLTVIKKSEE